MSRRTVFRVGISVLAAMMLTLASAATTRQPMSGEELTDAAGVIVVGECTGQRSQWFGRSLVTLYTVSVTEVIKGQAPTEVTVVVPGGFDTSGPVPVAVTFPGAPVLSAGEELLLFLDAVEDATEASSGGAKAATSGGDGDHFAIVGFSQGAFPVVTDGDKSLVAQSRGSRLGALPLDVVTTQIRTYLQLTAGR